MDSLGYFELLFDDGRFDLHDTDLTSGDPLSFTDRKPYAQRLDAAIGKTKLNDAARAATGTIGGHGRSEEHTSELQSRGHLVCRLLLEKKKTKERNRSQ